MSKVPYTVNIDRFICTELEEIRKMTKTLDFSGLLATVERIQHHGSAMEEGLYEQRSIINQISSAVKDEKLSKKEKLDKIQKLVNKK